MKITKIITVFLMMTSVTNACHILSHKQPQCRPVQFYCSVAPQWLVSPQSVMPSINSEQGNVQGGSASTNTVPFDLSAPQTSLANYYPGVFPQNPPIVNNLPFGFPDVFFGGMPPFGVFDPRKPQPPLNPPNYHNPGNPNNPHYPNNPGNKPPPNKPKPDKPHKPEKPKDDDCDPPIIRPVPEGSTLVNCLVGIGLAMFLWGCYTIRKYFI